MDNSIIIKLEHGNNVQKSNEEVKINRISSSVSPYHFIRLVGIADNKINPRSAKENGITSDIRETLETSPNLFWLMSKGILLATENCTILDRGRIRLTVNGEREGIMDGGHNALAISQYLVSKLYPKNKLFKTWEDCKNFWAENEKDIIKKFNELGGNDYFKFSIPVEIVFPSEEDGGMDEYYQNISPICTARNTNVQLKQATQDNQVGIYDVIKNSITCSKEVIWKSGQAGSIKAEDVVSLVVIPLLFLQEKGLLPENRSIKTFNAVSVYSQKGKCVDFYGDVLKHPSISEKKEDKYELNSSLVRSALELADDVIKAYDKLYLEFPDIYNGNPGKFGRISSVKWDGKKKYAVPFHTNNQESDYSYPSAFFIPLFCGIKQLMEVDEQEQIVRWKVNPASDVFNFRHLDCKKYVEMIKFLDYNPLKVGKASMMYLEGEDVFKAFLTNSNN